MLLYDHGHINETFMLAGEMWFLFMVSMVLGHYVWKNINKNKFIKYIETQKIKTTSMLFLVKWTQIKSFVQFTVELLRYME